ncbi:MAG: hypothetical protein KF870_11785 [Leadbetterella sp.]|nr:hypothetical protein [Leadbetterella sp.]
MRNILLFLWVLFTSVSYANANDGDQETRQVKIGILVNGDACNVNWQEALDPYEVINASVRKFLISQYDWNLQERLFQYQPDYCILYAGLPDIALQIPISTLINSYEHLVERMIAHHIRPVIIKTLPVSGHPLLNQKIKLFNRKVEELTLKYNVVCFQATDNLILNEELDSSLSTDSYLLNTKGLSIFSTNIKICMDEVILFHSGNLFPRPTRENLLNEGISMIIGQSPSDVRVVMLGNSITAGGDWNKLLNRKDVRNAGQGGHLSGQMIWLLDTCVIAVRPEWCFVMAGINDLFNHVSTSTIYANQIKILETLKSNGIRPVMQSTLYLHDKDGLNRDIKEVNEAIALYCRKNVIDYIDLNPYLCDEKGLKEEYTTDGTHLKAIAYAKWAEVLTQFLEGK